jgi:hypothetical protein
VAPIDRDVTTPEELTVATFVFCDAQVNGRPDIGLSNSSRADAVSGALALSASIVRLAGSSRSAHRRPGRAPIPHLPDRSNRCCPRRP